MPRFVLLYHDCPPDFERASHWDFMLEDGETLRTWALRQLPAAWQAAHGLTATHYSDCPALSDANTVAVEHLTDHRLAYLHKEGPLSGNRGQVRRIDSGTYDGGALSADEWCVTLAGAAIRGNVELRRLPEGWTLSCG